MKPIVIGLTERWLERNEMVKMFRLKGYHKLTTRKRDWGNRRGVGFYMDDMLNFRVFLKHTTRDWLLVEIFFCIQSKFSCYLKIEKI